jgi:hypothetical protein
MKAIKQSHLEKAKSNLENACGILGWDDDELLHILQTRQFLKACRKMENLGEFELEYTLTLIAKSDRLHPFLRKTYDLVQAYLVEVMEGRLSDLDGNKGDKMDVSYIVRFKNDMITSGYLS